MPSGKKLKAIVVDDEPVIVKLMSIQLERKGYKVHTANNERDGMKLVSDHPDADVLITDWNLQAGGKGSTVIDHLRNAEKNMDMHVLGMSGYAGGKNDPNEMQRFIDQHNETHVDAPLMHFLQKPYALEQLYDKLEEMGVGRPRGKSPSQESKTQGRELIHEMKPFPSATKNSGQKISESLEKGRPYPLKRFRE